MYLFTGRTTLIATISLYFVSRQRATAPKVPVPTISRMLSIVKEERTSIFDYVPSLEFDVASIPALLGALRRLVAVIYR